LLNVLCLCSFAGDSRHGLYNSTKKDLYEHGRHVAQCTKAQAVGIIVFVFSAIFLTALVGAFFRPFTRKSSCLAFRDCLLS
jgi:hypothetical protein